jgi:hypothetical protein
LQRPEHIRWTINQLGSSAGERSRLESAAKFLRLLVQRSHANLWMGFLKPLDLFPQKLIFGRTRLMPDRDNSPRIMLATATKEK